MTKEEAKQKLKSIVNFYKLNDENNYDYSDEVLISMQIVLDEIDRLNNIINELEEELDRGYRDLFNMELVPGRELILNIKNYLKELKENNK